MSTFKKNPLDATGEKLLYRLIQVSLLVFLLMISYQIIQPFILPVLWATILVYTTFPLYKRLNSLIPNRPYLTSFILTLALFGLIITPIVASLITVQGEAFRIYLKLQELITSNTLSVPEWLKNIPVLGKELTEMVANINKNPQEVTGVISEWVQSHLSYGKKIFQVAVKNMVYLSITICTAFFLYKDGENLYQQISRSLHQTIGERADSMLKTIANTTRAVVYGLGLTAAAQAILAGLAYFVVSFFVPTMPNPLFLTLITFVLALIPMGTPFTWGSLTIWLFSQGYFAPAIGLGLWGFFVVSWIDNIIRPMVISSATQIPFLIIMFGVLGGLTAFGLIGLFIGPVVLAVFLAIWREWISEPTISK